MKQKKKEFESTRYEPPEVEVWQVSVERGFAGSDPTGDTTTPDMPIQPLSL